MFSSLITDISKFLIFSGVRKGNIIYFIIIVARIKSRYKYQESYDKILQVAENFM